MGDRGEADEPLDSASSTREVEEVDLTRVAAEWRRQTNEAREQQQREAAEQAESRLKAQEEWEWRFPGCLLQPVNCCAGWSLTMLVCAGLLLVLMALGRRARG